MKITAISDLHGYYPELPGGDLLLLGGDYTGSDQLWQWVFFFDWLREQKYEKKIMILGNHDAFLGDHFPEFPKKKGELERVQAFLKLFGEFGNEFEFLSDSGTEFKGIKIWGTPWTNWFKGVNPRCKAYMVKEKQIKKKFEAIPNDIDILLCHSPPYGILDMTMRGERVGSKSLLNKMDSLKAKVMICGHIHECGGKGLVFKRPGYAEENNIRCFNVSHVDECYEPINKPTNFEI